MCLAFPAKVLSIDGCIAEVDIMGNRSTADISVLGGVAVGDYIMIHAGLGIQKYEEQEALENLALLESLLTGEDRGSSVQ